MDVSVENKGTHSIASLSGRLDAFGARQLDERLATPLRDAELRYLVMDMRAAVYISSAGIRTLLAADKTLRSRQGRLLLAGLSGYCRDVIEMAGFGDVWPQYETPSDALRDCGLIASEGPNWERAEKAETPSGSFRFLNAGGGAGAALVLGHIEDVLASRVTPEHMSSKQFSQTEFSIGLGGLGDRLDDYFPIMGEMATIGGAMVWLPTDGHDTADYLIPKKDTGAVRIRTGFNVALSGGFNELAWFESGEENGTTMADVYRSLFALAKQRRSEFKGGLGLAMRAEMSTVYGSGVLRSPIAANRPDNGEWITHPSNFGTWFEIDKEPRHRNVTGLLTGLGVDLTADRAAYDTELFGATFYVNPANPNQSDIALHNHGVFFAPLPFGPAPRDLGEEIETVVETGQFVDMRHLLDGSRIRSAVIGISYLQEFRRDPTGQSGHR